MKKNKVFTPPNDWDNSIYSIDGKIPLNLFLAGTIDNGDSVNWQKALIDELNEHDTVHPIAIYNPRREEWPSSSDHAEIEKQIEWELYHLERADLIVMNILLDSKSPISLMEIGLFARQHKMIVFCNPNFYRYDNVKVVCRNYDVPLYDTNDILVIRKKVLEYANQKEEHIKIK